MISILENFIYNFDLKKKIVLEVGCMLFLVFLIYSNAINFSVIFGYL